MPYLTKDIFSHSKKSLKYGSKGDEVKVIAHYSHVVIVENINGNRFSLCAIYLTDVQVEAEPPTPKPAPKPLTLF